MGALAAASDEAKAPASDARVQRVRHHRGERRPRPPTMLRPLFPHHPPAAPSPPAGAFLALFWCLGGNPFFMRPTLPPGRFLLRREQPLLALDAPAIAAD